MNGAVETEVGDKGTILVTGGAGYIGSLLVRELLSLGETVGVVDTEWFGNSFDAHKHLELVKSDLRYHDTADVLEGVDAVIHLAGLSNDPTADFAPDLNSESNVLATRRLAEAVARKARSEQRVMRCWTTVGNALRGCMRKADTSDRRPYRSKITVT